jgi:nitrite reductase/ring-hydroxylating ferredoxin subunit
MAFNRLCKVEDVPVGKLGAFSIINKDILVANVNGRFYCLAARCTHAGAPLVKGTLNGDILECPWHDASFRVTDGAILYGPPRDPLKVYPCIVKGKFLYLDLHPTNSKD